jgi:hypothetical protein
MTSFAWSDLDVNMADLRACKRCTIMLVQIEFRVMGPMMQVFGQCQLVQVQALVLEVGKLGRQGG